MQSFASAAIARAACCSFTIESIFFHCSKAIVRSKLWEEATKIDRKSLPSTGTIISELSQGQAGRGDLRPRGA
jgi:hypothetical protein